MSLKSYHFHLTSPQPYNFAASVRDHGWIYLRPFHWIDEQQAIVRPERLADGRVVLLTICQVARDEQDQILAEVNSAEALSEADIAALKLKVHWILKLNEDLGEFYQRAQAHPAIWQVLHSGRGRLLRSPTLFEDLVKTICTTNINWAQTEAMITRLVDNLGEPYPPNPIYKTFPTPGQVMQAGIRFFEQEVRLGYRNAYVLELASTIVEGQLDLEALARANLTAAELKSRLKAIKGVGDYAANTMLMLMGHYHAPAVDSEFRSFVRKAYFEGTDPGDKVMAAVYQNWGQWQHLAYWFDRIRYHQQPD